jgi:large subunit ribosomal protein L35
MPKMKTHSGAKKRFRATGSGKLRGRSAFTTHILEKKSPKRKRRQAQPALISTGDRPRVRELLGAPAPKRKRGKR